MSIAGEAMMAQDNADEPQWTGNKGCCDYFVGSSGQGGANVDTIKMDVRDDPKVPLYTAANFTLGQASVPKRAPKGPDLPSSTASPSMSDDEADPELLALLRQSLGLGPGSSTGPPTTRVLEGAEYVCDNAIDVAIDMANTKAAAHTIWKMMQARQYSTQTWSEHELHPKAKDESTLNFIFTMDLLNFSFWSPLPPDQRFAVDYNGRRWTGYWSLVAALQRALDEGTPITDPYFWQEECTLGTLAHIFRSATAEPIPLLEARFACLREAGQVLDTDFGWSFGNCIREADHSAARLVNLLAARFQCFRDEVVFHGKRVRFYKRAQILVADVWACFNGQGYGRFDDIDDLTIFPDYRIPQMLHSLGCLMYSPPLEGRVKRLLEIENGENCEIELRGCSIWCVEMIRRQMIKEYPATKSAVNAVLIDFFLYDLCKERESDRDANVEHEGTEIIPHHRTRSIWY